MDALDGNAIAGELFEVFGEEMTTGWQGYLMEALLTMVLVSVRGSTRIDLAGFKLAPPHDHGAPADDQPAS